MKPLNVANELKCSAALKHSLNMIGPSVMMMRDREMSCFLRQIQGKLVLNMREEERESLARADVRECYSGCIFTYTQFVLLSTMQKIK